MKSNDSGKVLLNEGTIVMVQGPVIDVRFDEGHLPNLLNAIEIPLPDGKKLISEVMQHIGDDVTRTVSMGPTEGLYRGMKAYDTGCPIKVPVGQKTL